MSKMPKRLFVEVTNDTAPNIWHQGYPELNTFPFDDEVPTKVAVYTLEFETVYTKQIRTQIVEDWDRQTVKEEK